MCYIQCPDCGKSFEIEVCEVEDDYRCTKCGTLVHVLVTVTVVA